MAIIQKRRKLQPTPRVTVYATEDLRDGRGHVVTRKGAKKLVHRVDAREHCNTGQWSMTPPAGVEPRATRAKTKGPRRGRGETPPAATPGEFRLTDIPGISRPVELKLQEAGLGTLPKLQRATVADLTAVRGIGTKYAEAILGYVRENFPVATEAPDDLEAPDPDPDEEPLDDEDASDDEDAEGDEPTDEEE